MVLHEDDAAWTRRTDQELMPISDLKYERYTLSFSPFTWLRGRVQTFRACEIILAFVLGHLSHRLPKLKEYRYRRRTGSSIHQKFSPVVHHRMDWYL